MKVAIIRDTEEKPAGLWWDYAAAKPGRIEMVKAYADMIMNASLFDAVRILNVETVRANLDPGVLAEMIKHPACFVDYVEIPQRLPVVFL